MIQNGARGAYAAYAYPDGWMHTIVQKADGWAVSFKRPETAWWTDSLNRYETPQEAQRALDELADELALIAGTIQMERIIVSFEPIPKI